jgi:hypothetical protein
MRCLFCGIELDSISRSEVLLFHNHSLSRALLPFVLFGVVCCLLIYRGVRDILRS